MGEDQKERIRQFIAECDDPLEHLICMIAPEVTNNYEVKLGIILVLASAIDEKPTSRDRIHLLMHGEPGTAKSMFLDYLREEWGSCYISCDPTAASLKGDVRRRDMGSMIFSTYDGGIIAIDDIELMKDINTLRDVMEFGKYTITKGGKHKEFNARCRIVGATNDLCSLPRPILSRFDLVYPFEVPTIDESMEIVSSILCRGLEAHQVRSFLKLYLGAISEYQPGIGNKQEITDTFNQHFRKAKKGKTGRWISSVWRIAKALARIRMKDVESREIQQALEIKMVSDRLVEGCE